MKIFVTSYFAKKYKKLVKKYPKIKETIDSKITIFKTNRLHPSLRLHKLTSKDIESWSISIKDNLRIIFQYVEEGILLTDIGSHDEVY